MNSTLICPDFEFCGGCGHQDISYEEELKLKENMVLKLLTDNNVEGYEFLGTTPAPSPTEYRNKMEYSFGDEGKNGALALGMRKRKSFYEVVTSKHCNIVDGDFRAIITCVLEFFKNTGEIVFHKKRHIGALRHLVVRKGKFTGEILVNLVTSSQLTTDIVPLKELLVNLNLSGELVGVLHTTNDDIGDTIKLDNVKLLHGRDYFNEILLGLNFKITAQSFFQTNSAGAEKLYTTVADFVDGCKLEKPVLFDLYCGTGTIAQILSKNAEKVYGIEIVEEAVEAAEQNAELNGINNCFFVAGDVLKTVDTLDVKPDIIVLDPPRDGIHKKAVNKIINFNAKYIVYVSCKPSSLARDLIVFKEHNYNVEKIKIHDLFPRTKHVETVALLVKSEG